ncbi:MAG: hypothetical protein CMI86_01320 [Candidatus Pelagibacter sp.]|nr:hypothetical protein [Candidatus Pelagibacter sp.]
MKLSNQLKNEKSPYLKQHSNNPVNWFAWNKFSLEKAKKERKPIFLSVGYASCHWCHVMAHESFENPDTAKILNEKFINIKVDREERPDLDSTFQKSLSILTGAQGGWPLSMFLDENAVPFTGGTYFPPREIQNRPSFNQVILNVSKVYNDNREKIISQVSQLKAVFKDLNRKNAVLSQDLEPYAEKILQYLDKDNGGFKGAPKFPQFYIFQTLLYFYNITKKNDYLIAVKTLLENISSKGIYDHLDGGISRYTVDDKWMIPHFEKMLYDNIQYVLLTTHYIKTCNSNYLFEKLKQTIKFINSKFKSDNNLVGSALDADSEGVEGKFYTWSYNDIKSKIDDKFDVFKKKFDISKEGNFEGLNILSEKVNVDLTKEEQKDLISAKKILYDNRDKRIKPFFDNKIQTDLNCYWYYSNLYASLLINDKNIYDNAINSIEILINKLDNKIYHCYNNNYEVDVFLEDYCYLSLVFITLYELENKVVYLDKCKLLSKKIWDLFFSKENNFLQKNIIDNNDLFVNPIDIADNNIPNGNSIYLMICNKLKNITGDEEWQNKIDLLTKSYHSYINFNFSQMFSYLKILNICDNNVTITLYGKYNDRNFLKQVNALTMGDATIIHKDSEEEFFSVVCKNQTCSKKLKNINEISDYLKNMNNA